MAMKKRFYSVNGQMMGYESGGVKKDFLTDHLGSITAEIDQTQTRTYDTRYSAYGRNNWSTGTGCGFGWVGSYGYRETGLFHMSHYVRARHYSYVTGNWSTVDPLWPDESGYGYVEGRCAQWIDLTGNQKQTPPPGGLVLPKPIIVQPPPQIDPEITPGIRPKPGFGGGRGSACAVAAEVGWTLGRILDENLGISDAILEFLFNNPEEVLPECPKPPRTKSSILNTHRQLYFQGCKRYQGTIEPSFRCPMGTHYNIFYRCKDNIHGTSSIPKDAREF